MTVHDLHDALNLLPSDLVAATDKLRAVPKPKVVQWRRWVSLAAVLALVVGTGWVFQREILPAMGGGGKETAAEAPAAMAQVPESGMTGADSAIVEVPAAEAAPREENKSKTDAPAEAEEESALCIDHSHVFAEEDTTDKPAVGYCGNLTVTIDIAGEVFTIAGSDAIAITDILINLNYDPDEVCRCAADVTVDTETLTGIRVSTAQGFARCEMGQAALTEEQAKTIQEIIDRLQ